MSAGRFFLFVFCLALFSPAASQQAHAATLETSVSSGDVSVSSGDIGVLPALDELIEAYSSYDAYYGSISSTYVEYMRGYLPKLLPAEHYVGARVGQYEYIFAYGEELSFDGSTFSGSVDIVRWNTYNNGTFSSYHDDAFRLDPGSYLVYTDLSGEYPALATSSDFTLRQILILFTIFCICLTVNSMYQVRKVRRTKKEDADA